MFSIEDIRRTSDDRVAASIRWLLGILFVMTGVMKLVVPMLAEAWSGQLIAAEIPLYTISRWSVPFIEIGVGIAIAAGLYARMAALVIIGIMTVATYVHVVVCRPGIVFPCSRPNRSSRSESSCCLCIYFGRAVGLPARI